MIASPGIIYENLHSLVSSDSSVDYGRLSMRAVTSVISMMRLKRLKWLQLRIKDRWDEAERRAAEAATVQTKASNNEEPKQRGRRRVRRWAGPRKFRASDSGRSKHCNLRCYNKKAWEQVNWRCDTSWIRGPVRVQKIENRGDFVIDVSTSRGPLVMNYCIDEMGPFII